ncbi:MAG: exodeoxyribonuclease VII large subunit [Caldimonas sp.]
MIESTQQAAARPLWGVAALLQAVADALAARFGACAVRGEISGFSRSASGHCYFNLKDAERGEGALRCCLFRRAAGLVDFQPADGQLVDLRGRLGVYGPRGELQLVVESMQRAGAGALYEQFLRLRARLEAEGLFDAERKRALPLYPRRIGVVTSLAAAALHDVLTALARRAPQVEVIVYPSLVQGADAPAALRAAIESAGTRVEVDTLIVCRGGGSLEDLWAFNDEAVVRAIHGAPMPVLCGVGHETDVTLADLAADVRAPTPTAAAELAAPERASCIEALVARASAMRQRIDERLDTHAQRLDRAALRLARPSEAARRHGQRLELLAHRLMAATRRDVEIREARRGQNAARLVRAAVVALVRDTTHLRALRERLDALDPRRVLSRGYALLTGPGGHAVTSAAEVAVGMALRAELADGSLGVAVTGIEPRTVR